MEQPPPTSRSAVVGALLLLVALVGAIVFLAGVIGAYFSGLPTTQGAALLTAGIGGIGSLFAIYLNRRAARAQEVEAALRQRKADVYEEFVRFWVGSLLSAKGGVITKPEEEIRAFFSTFTQKLIVWGSDEVVLENGDSGRCPR